MEYRLFGKSGLKVPVLTLAAATFGGKTEFFNTFNTAEVAEAARLVDICLEAGLCRPDGREPAHCPRLGGGAAQAQWSGEARLRIANQRPDVFLEIL